MKANIEFAEHALVTPFASRKKFDADVSAHGGVEVRERRRFYHGSHPMLQLLPVLVSGRRGVVDDIP